MRLYETIIILLIIFFFKSMDCSLNVLKNIYLIKEKYFLSAICAAGSVVFFIYTAQQTGWLAYLAIGIATFFGNYLPPIIMQKLEPDALYVYEITSDTLASGKTFADNLRELNIPVNTFVCHDKQMNKVIMATVYSSNKTVSRIIEEQMPANFKVNIKQSLQLGK